MTLKKGWDWVFNGGTAKYKGPPIPNPNPPPGIDRHPIVRPVETGNSGVTINTISPGYIGTKMVMAIPQEVLDSKIIPQIPMGRLGKPEEVAAARKK